MLVRIGDARAFQDFEVSPVPGMILAGTGHRPDKLGGYSPTTLAKLKGLATLCLDQSSPTRVISGMALGWDQALAEACVDAKIPFDAYIPFEGQENRWPADSQRRYRELLAKARRINVTSFTPHISAFNRRNRDMIRDCDMLLALWNGDQRGGTANAVNDAMAVRREILNVWPMWEKMQ